MNIFAIVCGVLGGLAIPAFFLGKKIRQVVTDRMWKVEED